MTEQTKDIEIAAAEPNLPVVDQQAAFFVAIEKMTMNPDIDVSKIKQIMDMQEHALDRNAKQAFNEAMALVQSKIEIIANTRDNSQTNSKYANLGDVIVKAKPIYTKEGFSLMFYEGETKKENHTRVCVDIMHRQGHTEQRYGDFAVQTTGIAGKAMMTLIHGEGSAFSYGRRYLTCMIFNIPTGDDNDGNGAEKMGKLEKWQVKCDEVGETGTSKDVAAWWKKNSVAIKKDLSTPKAAEVYQAMLAHEKRLKAAEKAQEREK